MGCRYSRDTPWHSYFKLETDDEECTPTPGYPRSYETPILSYCDTKYHIMLSIVIFLYFTTIIHTVCT